jgi:hypothetical protein
MTIPFVAPCRGVDRRRQCFIHQRCEKFFVQSEVESVPLSPGNAENKSPYNLVFLLLVPNNPADPRMTADLSSGEPT